jgi:vancomycin resistance protein VanJ
VGHKETAKRIEWRRLAVAVAYVYLIGVLEWTILRLLFLDRWWWLFLLNTVGVYLFVPLLLTVIVAAWTRRRMLWAGSVLALLAGLGLFGPHFLPNRQDVDVSGPRLTVMTFNVLGHNTDPAPILDVIREADADLIAIQELNGPIAEAFHRELADAYPYRIFDPQPGVTGMGVLSRYPLTPTGETLPGEWPHTTPQVLEMDFEGVPVTVIHAHPFHTHFSLPNEMRRSIDRRDAQTQAIADFVADQTGPVVAPGDFNTPPQTTAYAHLTENLVDTWHQAGWGLGHTWSGTFPLRWLIRIDYIFYSAAWRVTAIEAKIGPWDGTSDHRPVIATLVLSTETGTKE